MAVLLLCGTAILFAELLARAGDVDPSTLTGKVMCGYQGWFHAEGDGAGLGWVHYGRGEPRPGRCSIDFWPDMS